MSLVKLALVFLVAHVATATYFVFDHAPGTAAALYGLPLDDAWIHLVYARSLAALHGFAYNPGQLETGSTSPLWAILLTPAAFLARAFGIGAVIPAKVIGMGTGLAASFGSARAARALGLGQAAQVIVGLTIALDPGLAFAQVSGMEVMLAAALALWAVAELAGERVWPAAIAAALAPLARPEMMLLSLPVLAILEWRMHRQGARPAMRLLVLVPSLVSVGGWMLYCQLVSDYPLPSTFYAKFKSQPEIFSHNVALIVGEVLPAWPWFTYGLGFGLWALGGVVLWRRGLPGVLATVFPLAYVLAAASPQFIAQSWPFYWQRYLLPALPFILLSVTAGAAHIVSWAWENRRAPWATARAGVAALAILGALAALPSALHRSANLYAWNCQNIDELNVAMAKWLRDHAAPGETIAVTDAGAARYFGEHPVLDLIGLNNHRLLHRAGTSAPDLANVNLVASFPALVPHLRASSAWRAIHRVTTSHLTICDCPQSELVAYRRVAPTP
jgi:hypothetical protein